MLHRSHFYRASWLVLVIALLGGNGQALALPFAYVANYNSNDVSAYAINAVTGALTPVSGSPFVAGTNPQSITVAPNGAFAYVANTGSNNVSAYSINAVTGALTPVAGSPFAAGPRPWSIAVAPSGAFAYVANGVSNYASAFTINATTGALTPVAGSPFATGSAPFSVTVAPSGAFAYVANYNSDDVSAYSINASTGALTPVAGSPFANGTGTAPQSVTIAPGGKFAYVANNGSPCCNNVSAYSINTVTGALTPVAGSPFAAGANPFSVTVSPSGAFAYVANSASNVSAYSINATTGALTPVAGAPFAAGTNPVSVTVTANGAFAYVANRGSNSVSAYTVNATTGVLTPVIGAPFAAGTAPASITTTDTPGPGPSGCVIPPSGMVLWLPGDNSANDISGFSNNATLQGSASYGAGYVGSAFLLNTSSDFVEVPGNPPSLDFGLGNFSIDAWIRTTNISGSTITIVDKRTGSTTNPVGYELFLAGGQLGFQLADGSQALNRLNPLSPVITDGNWHHVAATINRTSTTGGTLYVDGVVVHTFDPTTRPGNISNTANLRIGQHYVTSVQTFQAFQGGIDELEIFNRELSAAEIQAIYNAGSAGKCKLCASPPSGMVAWYPLNELAGATAINDIAPSPSSTFNNVGTPQPGAVSPIGPSPAGPAPVAGQVGGALYFYGPYIEVAPNSELDFSTGDFTIDAGVTALSIDAWVRIVQVGPTLIQPIVDKFSSPGGPGFSFYIRNQNLELNINGNIFVSTGPPIAFANPLANAGPWKHVAVTVQGGGRRPGQGAFYIDGVLAGTFAPPLGSSINNSLPLWIGKSRISQGVGTGEIAIDELEIFNRALPQSEIQSIVNAGSFGKCKTPSGTGTVPGGTIVEYYWPNGNNYFITADPNEIASLDAASSASGGGPGTWNRTGVTFKAGGPTQVCRFFGNTNVNPATQVTYGPNSHFYTVFPNECANLQAAYNPNAMSWKLEAPAGPYPPPFFMTQPTTLGPNGTCPASTVPVYRAYDNSPCVNVSSVCVPQPNHRITTSLTAINQVVAQGWTNEGVIMCAAP